MFSLISSLDVSLPSPHNHQSGRVRAITCFFRGAQSHPTAFFQTSRPYIYVGRTKTSLTRLIQKAVCICVCVMLVKVAAMLKGPTLMFAKK